MQEGLEVASGKAVYRVLRVGSVAPQLDLPPGICVQILLVPAWTASSAPALSGELNSAFQNDTMMRLPDGAGAT